MPPPAAPKFNAPAPPKSRAPPPPPTKSKSVDRRAKAKPIHQHSKSQSTYDLGKDAVSTAGAAAKIAFLSLGSKVKKDVQAFTKSELQHAGIKKSKPAAYNQENTNSNTKKAGPKHLLTSSRSKSYDPQRNKRKPLKPVQKQKVSSKKNGLSTNKRTKPKPPDAANKKSTSNKKISQRVALFEKQDKQSAIKTKKAKKPQAPARKRKKPPKIQEAQEKNLRPSFAKKRNSPITKSVQNPPTKLKLPPNKTRRAKSNPLKRKQMQDIKPKAAPKKIHFHLFKKNVSQKQEEKKDSHSDPKLPPAPPPKTFSSKRGKSLRSQSYGPNNDASSFNLKNINSRLAKPEDYNEIQYIPVDAMELRWRQKQNAGLLVRSESLMVNKPTTASDINSDGDMVRMSRSISTDTGTQQEGYTMTMKKKKKPPLPKMPVPIPKPKRKKANESHLRRI